MILTRSIQGVQARAPEPLDTFTPQKPSDTEGEIGADVRAECRIDRAPEHTENGATGQRQD